MVSVRTHPPFGGVVKGSFCLFDFNLEFFYNMIMNKIVLVPDSKTLSRKDELILIPKKEYQKLLERQPKIIPTVKLSPKERKAIAKSEKEFSQGKYISLEELEYELVHSRSPSHT